jgi:CubicO group peptidase (beta-lactamase class C family)
MLRALSVLLTAGAALAGGSPPPATDCCEENRNATELAGVWFAQRDFGPRLGGTIDLRRVDNQWIAHIAGVVTQAPDSGDNITMTFGTDEGTFRGRRQGGAIIGHWIQPATAANYNRFASPVSLYPVAPDHWRGEISPLDDRMTFYLVLRKRPDGTIGGFLHNPEANFGRFFDIRNVTLEDNTVIFIEPEDRVRLHGPYYPDYDSFSLYIPDAGGTFDFKRVDDAQQSHFRSRAGADRPYRYRPPEWRPDGWQVAHLEDVDMAVSPINELIQFIDTPPDSVDAPYIHAVLVARNGKLVVEEYFHGYTAEMPHDTRSASKTVTATLAGLAIQGGEPISVSSPVYEIMYDGGLPGSMDSRKTRIQLKHLLTMTPGLACDDNDYDSPGGEYQMQSQTGQPDWWQYTLDLPGLHEPGEVVTYCSASPNLVYGVLQHASGRWLPQLYQTYFADPMQMGPYYMNLMPSGDAYGGGGLYVQGRDFLKLAQLYLDGGMWAGRRLLGDDWTREAVTPYKEMFNQGYGYGWWILELPYEGRTVEAFYAGGNGGQYSMGIPELGLAIVMFGANYGQMTTHLAKKVHIPKYILRSVAVGSQAGG